MKQYIRKVFVILITILTLGMYVPPQILNTNAAEVDSSKKINEGASHSEMELTLSVHEEDRRKTWTIDEMTKLAKLQTIQKLGPKIVDSINDDYLNIVLENMEAVLQDILVDLGEEELYYYGISENPTSGYGEKIFDLYDVRTNNEIAKFHVSRINRPLEGYWFSFHYHLADDNFTEHYLIGELYYDKNTPPKWMA